MTEPSDPVKTPPEAEDAFPDTWEEVPERPVDDQPLIPGDPTPAIPSQPPL